MGFFNEESRKVAASGSFETGGGDIEPIPSNTTVLAAPDEAKVDNYQGDDYISLRWTVLAPPDYKNRKIFQKLRVYDADSKKADKAKRMLAAIDANAGGHLLTADTNPTDALLTKSLVNKPMLLKLQIWEIEDANTGEKKRGNWISAVAPRGNAQVPQQVPQQTPVAGIDLSDVPF